MPVHQFLHDKIANYRVFDTSAGLTPAENRAHKIEPIGCLVCVVEYVFEIHCSTKGPYR
jgi:hypothetical protein